MLTTLNGMFSKPKPHRIDFIKENKKKLKEISSMVNQNTSKSRFDVTKSKSSQTDIRKSGSSTGLKENRSSTTSGFRLSAKGSIAVFLQEKKDKGSVSNVSLSANQKSSQKLVMQKNQSSQTIDPRRFDQLFHEGVIKYPSNRVLQQLAEIEKQKANRLDVHVKKEYFRRNKVKQKNPNKILIPKIHPKTGEGDELEEHISDFIEEEEPEPEPEPEKVQEPDKSIEEKDETVTEKSVQNLPPIRAADIIRQTTEDHINYSPKGQGNTDRSHNKADTKPPKRPSKKLSKEEEEALKIINDPQCPPGHIPLPDAERKKTLHMLRASHAELVREMNLLPVRTDTLRVRQKKIQLENQLNKIEEGIKVFNKSKVYVKIEE